MDYMTFILYGFLVLVVIFMTSQIHALLRNRRMKRIVQGEFIDVITQNTLLTLKVNNIQKYIGPIQQNWFLILHGGVLHHFTILDVNFRTNMPFTFDERTTIKHNTHHGDLYLLDFDKSSRVIQEGVLFELVFCNRVNLELMKDYDAAVEATKLYTGMS